MVGHYLAYFLEGLSLCGAHHVHHLVVAGPLLALAQNLLEEFLAVGALCQLEVVAALVAGKRKEDDPLAVVAQEGGYAVLAHVGRYGNGVEIVFLEERPCVHGRSVADVATLGISDDELVGVVLLDVLYRLLESHETFHAESLVEGKVGLVCHAVCGGGIYDGLVEREDGVFLVQEVGRYFLQVGVKAYAEETALCLDITDKFLSGHSIWG